MARSIPHRHGPALVTIWIRRRVHEPDPHGELRSHDATSTEAKDPPPENVISTGAKRSGETPALRSWPHPAANPGPPASRPHRHAWDQPTPPTAFTALFHGELGRSTLIITTMNAASLFAWWGLFSWITAFLSLPIASGGHGLNIVRTSTFTMLMQAGTFLGYTSFGLFADRFRRKRVYIAYLVIAAGWFPPTPSQPAPTPSFFWARS